MRETLRRAFSSTGCRKRAGVLSTLWALSFAAAPGTAHAMLGDSLGVFGLDGNLRSINGLIDLYGIEGVIEPGAEGFSQTALRLIAGGYPTEWLRYEVHAVQTLVLQTADLSIAGGLGRLGGAGGAGGRYRFYDGQVTFTSDANAEVALTLDRLNITVALPWLDLVIGRQAITLGKAYFWNPLDVFFSFGPTSFDREYKPGIDALRIDVPLGDFSGLNVIAAAGDPSAGTGGGEDTEAFVYRSGLLVRAFTTVLDWDVSVQAGKIHGGLHGGVAASGEAGPVAARVEAAYFWPLDDLRPGGEPRLPDAPTVVLGVGRLFESSLDLEAEYIYNGAGRVNPIEALRLVGQGFALHTSEHLVGAVASYELTPLMRGSLATIVALDDPSAIVQPGIVFSAADEVDILAGAILAFGERPVVDVEESIALPMSEFGTYPHLFYVEMKAYF